MVFSKLFIGKMESEKQVFLGTCAAVAVPAPLRLVHASVQLACTELRGGPSKGPRAERRRWGRSVAVGGLQSDT